MDTMRGQFSGQDEPDQGAYGSGETALDDAGTSGSEQGDNQLVGKDERRMQVRAYNFWASLLGNRTYPDIADLKPAEYADFGPRSVLLDFGDGIANPEIAWLGEELADECGTQGPITRLSDIPSRSLLSRITDHYMQILANQEPIGFEAEFVNSRGATILYRGILLPFSSDDETIDHIYGVINWKELAEGEAAPEPASQQDAVPAMLRDPLGQNQPHNEWADGPVDPGFGQPLSGYAPLELPLAEFGIADEAFSAGPVAETPTPLAPEDMGLADWLALARDEARIALGSEDRGRQALYLAIARAYDFALAAETDREGLDEMLLDAGIRPQEHNPLPALVRLVFGPDYDKTRVSEFAAVIAHGRRHALPRGTMADYLAAASGGIKAVVREERRMRRLESGQPDSARGRHEALVAGLRNMTPRPIDTLGHGGEFTVLVARRGANGTLELLGEVADDEALLGRAARHLLG